MRDDAPVPEQKRPADEPRRAREQEAEHGGDEPDLGQLPLDGRCSERRAVVRDRDRAQVREEREEHDEVGPDGLVQHQDRYRLRARE